MRVQDYFSGQPISLQSPLSPDKIGERINAAAGSILWPFSFGVVGYARFGGLHLRYRSSIFEYNAKPALKGRILPAPGGSSLDLLYRAPTTFIIFFAFWYIVVGSAFLGTVVSGVSGNLPPKDFAFAAAITAALLVIPVGMHMFGTRYSDEELRDILDFLAREAEARSA